MTHPHFHAESSVKLFGGAVADYMPIHDWLDVIWTCNPFLADPTGGDHVSDRSYDKPSYNRHRDQAGEHILPASQRVIRAPLTASRRLMDGFSNRVAAKTSATGC
jgi:hypothetical protein